MPLATKVVPVKKIAHPAVDNVRWLASSAVHQKKATAGSPFFPNPGGQGLTRTPDEVVDRVGSLGVDLDGFVEVPFRDPLVGRDIP